MLCKQLFFLPFSAHDRVGKKWLCFAVPFLVAMVTQIIALTTEKTYSRLNIAVFFFQRRQVYVSLYVRVMIFSFLPFPFSPSPAWSSQATIWRPLISSRIQKLNYWYYFWSFLLSFFLNFSIEESSGLCRFSSLSWSDRRTVSGFQRLQKCTILPSSLPL